MQNNKPWVDKITPENLPNEDLKMVALLLGLEAAIKLMCEIPGVNISIPKNATLPAKVLYIMEKYDGTKKRYGVQAIHCKCDVTCKGAIHNGEI